MRKNFERDGREMAMFRDFYELIQKHWITEDSDEYWNAFINDNNDFIRAYPDIPLARRLSKAFTDAQEEVFKNGRSV